MCCRVNDVWLISNKFGENPGHVRCAASSSPLPPKQGWQFWTGEKWEDDPLLVVRPGVMHTCTTIRVEAEGEAKKDGPGSLGVFTRVQDMWSAGHPVINSRQHMSLD